MNNKSTILAVDDTSESLALLIDMLTLAGYRALPADSGELALAAVDSNPPDLILLDVRMQGMDGFEVCRRLKARAETRNIPVIFISAIGSVKATVEGLKLGAADFITKPFQSEELLMRVKTHLALGRANVSLEEQAAALRQTNERLQAEVAERRRIEDELRQTLDRAERSRKAMLSALEDQRRAETALHDSEKRFRAMIEHSGDAIALVNAAGKIIYRSPSAYRLLGLDDSAPLGNSMFADVHPDDMPEVSKTFAKVSQSSREPVDFRARLKHADGSWRWVEGTGSNLLTEPAVSAIVVNYHDITERIQAEAALEERTRFANKLIDMTALSTWISDEHGTAIKANSACYKLFGATEEEVIGKYNVFKDEVAEKQGAMPEIKRAYATGEPVTFFLDYNFGAVEHVQVRDATHRFLQVILTPIVDKNGKVSNVVSQSIDLTDIKRVEEALRKSEETYRLLVNSIPDTSILLLDKELRYLVLGGNEVEKSGFDKSQIKGKTLREAYPREVTDVFEPLFQKALNGEATAFEMPYAGYVYFQQVLPVKDGAGNIFAAMQIATNITTRKRAEDVLHESEERFRTIFEQAAVGVVLTETKTGKFVRINQAYCDFLGYTPQEMLQKKFQNVTHPEDVQANVDHNAQLISGKIQAFSLEKRYIRRDGTVAWGRLTVSPLWKPDETPDVYFHIAVVEDITERRRAEDALRETNDYLENLFNHANAPIIVWDPQFKITRFNRAFEALTGKSAAEVIGKPLKVLFPPAQVKASMEHIRKTLTGERWEVVEIAIQHVDGSVRTVLWNSATLFSADGKTPVATIAQGQDITERKQAEEEIQQLNASLEQRVTERTQELLDAQEQLVRQGKLAVLGQMAGSVGHELRNPLGVISNSIYFLKMVQTDASDKIKEYLDRIENNVHIADKIIGDLLDFTRVKSVDRAAVSVPNLVRQTLERFPAPANVQVEIDIPADLPKMYADPQHVIQVLGNLTLNACQAMKDGGQLSVISRQSSEETDSLITGDWILITVRDTGAGISPENLKKLFEPLFTTKAKGIGLGLAVSKKLIEANGGRIEVESDGVPGKGSTFSVWLPIQK